MTRPLLPLSVLLALSCSDYHFSPGKNANGGSETGSPGNGPGGSAVDACSNPDPPDPVEVTENSECAIDLQTGTFTPMVEWSWGSSPFCGPPAVAQTIDTNGSGAIDSDDLPIIFLYQNNSVVALYGDGSGVAWQATGNYGQDGGLAVGDLDGDGFPEVVTANNSTVCALDGQTGSRLWCTGGLSSSLDPLGYSYPSIADMNGDGNPEVTCGSAILNGQTGAILGQGGRGKGAAPYGGTGASGTYGALSVPIDLDGDGTLELVTGNAAYDLRGHTQWTNSGLDGLVAVADFDGDGQGEIVKTSGIYVTGMESDGTEVWGPLTYTGNLGAPAIDDLDGDGTPDIVFAAQNKLIAMKWGGGVMWQAAISDISGAAGPTLFDFEMDGYPEVLYADEKRIQFFNGLDGSVKFTSDKHSSYTILETPVVADVDGDGQVEIALGHCTGNSRYGAITVYGDADESWPPGRKVWNQHAYHITNVTDLGGIPSPTQPNWPTYNSFRSGDVGRPPAEYWDLKAQILDVCEEECDSGGDVYVAAWPLNAGNIEAPAGIPVSLRAGAGGPILDVQTTTEAIPAGTSGEMLLFRVSADQLAGAEPVVTVDEAFDGTGVVYECDETNNAENFGSTVCDERRRRLP